MNRWFAPWAAALRIARRQALRAKGRTALSAVMVGLPLMLIAAVLVLLPSTMPTEATHVETRLGPTAQALVRQEAGCVPLAQRPNGDGPAMCGLTLDEDGNQSYGGVMLTAAEAEALVRELVPGAVISTQWESEAILDVPGAIDEPLPARTVDASGELARTVLVLEGETPLAPGEIGLSRSQAHKLGIAIGDTVDLEVDGATVSTTVTALLSANDAYIVAAPGTVPLDAAKPSWFVLGDEPLTWDDVVTLNRSGLFATSRHVLENPPARDAVPYFVIESGWGNSSSQVAAQVGLIIALAVLEVVLLVGPAFAVGARRQSRSLALVAATGGTRRDLRRIVLANGVVIGLGASVLAVGLGILLATLAVLWPYPDPYIVFPNLVVPPWVAGLVLVGTLIAVLAAWIPARQAARVDVVAALAGRRSEARPRATLGIVGLVAAGLGVPLALYGGRVGSSTLSAAGSVLIVLGLVTASGLIISATGVLARRAGVATRIALRDLSRQRGRTAPAAAAILGAIAAATAGAVYMAAEAQQNSASWQAEVSEGTVKVRLTTYGKNSLSTPETAAAVTAAIHDIDPGADVATLGVALPTQLPEQEDWWGLYPVEDESQICPWYLIPDPSEEVQAEYSDDPRCAQDELSLGRWSNSTLHAGTGPVNGVLVDDGTVLSLLDDDGAALAAEALAAGRTVVLGASLLWPDGTVRLQINQADATEPVLAATLPGAVVTSDLAVFHNTIVPPSAIDQFTGVDLTVTPHVVLATPSSPWTHEQENSLNAAVWAIDPDMSASIEARPERDVSLTVLALVGAASLLALGATWIASGLAAVESRADLATLSAVGAAPRVRRRVAGLQSGFLTATGVVPGIVGGLAVGWALVTASAGLGTEHPDPRWQMVVPWTVLAAAVVVLPLLAGGATALFTPAKLPLTRRAAE